MREQLRVLLLAVLIYVLVSDIMELASYIPVTSIAPLIQRLLPVKARLQQSIKTKEEDSKSSKNLDRDERVLRKLKFAQGTATLVSPQTSPRKGQSTSQRALPQQNELTAQETEQILQARQEWLKSMQDQCLPKLVCELHASLTGRNSLSDIEMGILTAIKDTSLGTSAEVVSKYHFAAHMGQLLAGVEGNGCHNFYPSCPIAGTQVLQILKAVKLRKA